MNFTTDLPKKDPLVSYIVASAVKCEKFFPGCGDEGPVYRMHAVLLKKIDSAFNLPPLSSILNDNEQTLSVADSKPRSFHGRVLKHTKKIKEQSS